MTKNKLRNLVLLGTILYTMLILYFMFFAFNRVDAGTNSYANGYGYKFMLIPEAVPLRLPQLSFSWLYDFGNIAAFIPFGILIPLLFRIDFKKFITFFIVAILFFETLQSLTFLGTFDIDDVISNTLGAMIGFIVYKVGASSKNIPQRLVASILSVLILFTGIIAVSESINFMVQKKEGPIQSLINFEETNNSIAQTKSLPGFTVSGNKVEPKLNLYSSEDGKSKEYTYHLGNKKDVIFYAYYGIPDNVDFKGEVSIIADENLFFQCSDIYDKDIVPVQMHFNQINEIKIIVTGNAKIWDVGITQSKHWWE